MTRRRKRRPAAAPPRRKGREATPPEAESPPLRRAVLLYNPVSGHHRGRRLLHDLAAALRRDGVEAVAVATGGPGDATQLAAQAAREGWDAVLVLGGDGTVREAAAGLLGSRVPLGILPAGTTNVLARALGLPPRPLDAAGTLVNAAPRSLDVGLCGRTPFLMMVSAGLDAEALRRVDPRLKARIGQAAVVLAGLRAWWRYTSPPLSLVADGRRLEATFAAVSNIPLYGGRYRLAPAARPDDRRLDLTLFRGRGRGPILAFAWSLLRGSHGERTDVASFPVEEVLLEGPADCPLQVDGDTCDERPPVAISLSPETVRVLAPHPQPGPSDRPRKRKDPQRAQRKRP